MTWTTNVLAEGSAVTQMPIKNVPEAVKTTFKENPPITMSHSVLISGLTAGVNNKITIVNNEIVGPTVYWPSRWPVLGDANLDCTVNILDLIFIRNKLNQDPGTGNNWQANVYGDGSINILDLIYVRNKLNTKCP